MRDARLHASLLLGLILGTSGCVNPDPYPYYGAGEIPQESAVVTEAPVSQPAYPEFNNRDEALVTRVRQSIRGNPELAGTEQNLVIVSENGTVTLRGIVASEQERENIGTRARSTVGVANVMNYLEVTPVPAVQVPSYTSQR